MKEISLEFSQDEIDVLWACWVVLIVIMVFGIVGNIICLIVWSKGEHSSKSACATYFQLIATTDLFNLCLNGSHYLYYLFYLKHTDGLRLVLRQNYLCKFLAFSIRLIPQIAAWLLVCLSFERALSIAFPLKFKLTGARKRAYICFGVTMVLFSVFDSPNTLRESNLGCSFNPQTVDKQILQILSVTSFVSFTVLVGILPFICIALCNIIILIVLFCKHRPVQTNGQRIARCSSLTIYTIAIGCLHCLANTPMVLFGRYSLDLFKLGHNVSLNLERSILIWHIVYPVIFLNSSLNFLLYSCFGNTFRKDLLKDICRINRSSAVHEPAEIDNRVVAPENARSSRASVAVIEPANSEQTVANEVSNHSF